MIAKRRDRTFLLMILPAFIGFVMLFILPTMMSFAYSVTNWSVYKPNFQFVGLDNYTQLFADMKNMAAIKHSIIYALVITIVQNALSIVFAVLLNRNRLMSGIVKSIFFFPAVLSVLVVGYLFQYIMTSADYGLLNNIVQFFGGDPVNWLGDDRIALYSVLSTQVWQWTGWSMVIYIANLKSIDASLYEAAEIDGAGKMQTFRRITLPLLYPAASFNILMSLIGGLKVFDVIFAMTKGGPGYATETIMTTMIREGFNTGRNAYACAIAVVFFVIVFVMTKIITFLLNKWEERLS
ncbi:carbohydrate ABC transporter permease [Paenibacillus sp. CECT 9249]|uniref:carbohydrate ABC transporter permease n=1 Tax=unclassified Paenibacillus TaxID=185978 RepID=UPI001C104364|nr:sugar ABC transporter permease [Paenibacillus sp. CECT 9249]MBU5444430.1 sugar ABC transporter permease [Paenibacillus sp. MSJ-34]CAH0120142.1 Melibiose/raffinose/stachyose import permease protein MelD [Paenibacillus sp. CECT 9249]